MAGSSKLSLSFNISVKVFLWSLATLLVVFLIIAALSWGIAGDQARLRVEEEIDSSLDIFQADLNQESGDLGTLGRWLVDQPSFAGMVRARDSAALTRYLEPWTEASMLSSLTVADSAGVVLTRVRVDQAPSRGDSVFDYRGVPEALRGISSSGIEEDKFGQLQGQLILPIRDMTSPEPIGAVILAHFLDKDFLSHISAESLTEAVVVYQGRIAASTLTSPQGEKISGLAVPSEVSAAESAGRPSGPVILKINGTPFLFKFSPMQSPSHATIGMFGAGVSTAAIEARQVAIFGAIRGGLLLVVLTVILFTALFARRMTAPIRYLDISARAMAEGDLSKSVVLNRRDELGDLARQLDRVRIKLSSALQASAVEKSYAEGIVSSMGVPVVVTDSCQTITLVNSAAEVLLSPFAPVLAGTAWEELFAPLNPVPSPANLIGSPLSGGGSIVHLQRRLKARPEFVFDDVCTPVLVHSDLVGYVHIVQEITGLVESLRSKDEFTVNVAHELRGPASDLRAFVDLLSQDYATLGRSEAKHLIEALERAIVRFQGLVENLIDIGNIEAGRFQIRPVSIDLGQIVEQATSLVASQLKANDQRLRIECASGLFVLADSRRVVQVLANLLSNASKYGPENEEIRLEATPDGAMARIAISDRGAGIAVADRPHLFERFYRSARAQERGRGLGLGLSLSKSIVEAHGGQIGFTSETGEGTTFWFTLPLARSAAG